MEEGLSNCYVFKNRLQEYAQKVGIPTPVYQKHNEGPSHLPSFSATVTVGNSKYASLPGFANHKLAEQSAAEIALIELSMSGAPISTPVHEIGLCKNLLQEYALKMNHAIPVYTCSRNDVPGKGVHFTCTVNVGGVKYVGGLASNKKEAVKKAARTALLTINGVPCDDSEIPRLTVIPTKRKETENPPNVKGSPAKEPSNKVSKKKRKRALQATATVSEEHNKQSEALNSSLVEIQLPEHAKGNDLISMSYSEGKNDFTAPVSSEVEAVVEVENPPKVKHGLAKKLRKKVAKKNRKKVLQSTGTEEHNKQSEVVNFSLVEIQPPENVKGNDLISMSYTDGQKDPSALVSSEVAGVVEAENLPRFKDGPEKEKSKKVNKKKRKRAQAKATVAEEHNKQTEALNSSIVEIPENVKGNDLVSMSHPKRQNDSSALIISEVAAVVEAENLPKAKNVPEKESIKKGLQATAFVAEEHHKQP